MLRDGRVGQPASVPCHAVDAAACGAAAPDRRHACGQPGGGRAHRGGAVTVSCPRRERDDPDLEPWDCGPAGGAGQPAGATYALPGGGVSVRALSWRSARHCRALAISEAMKAYSIAVTPHSSEAAVRSTGGGATRCLRRRGGPPSLAPFRCETVNGGWNARTAAAGHRGAAPAAARAGCRPNAAHARL